MLLFDAKFHAANVHWIELVRVNVANGTPARLGEPAFDGTR
ncbi:MAG: hypothetical protein ABI082_02520 [Dokdonella sp.]